LDRLKRAATIASEQVGAVRKRWLVDQYVSKVRFGGLWSINTNIEDYGVSSAPGYGLDVRALLAKVRTDLNSFSEGEIACLENHGYSLAHAALNSRGAHLLMNTPASVFAWPRPEWVSSEAAQAALKDSSERRLSRDLWQWLRSSRSIS